MMCDVQVAAALYNALSCHSCAGCFRQCLHVVAACQAAYSKHVQEMAVGPCGCVAGQLQLLICILLLLLTPVLLSTPLQSAEYNAALRNFEGIAVKGGDAYDDAADAAAGAAAEQQDRSHAAAAGDTGGGEGAEAPTVAPAPAKV